MLSYFMSMRGHILYKKLGSNLLYERRRQNLSQEELAELARIDRTYLARIESGKANPSITIIYKLTNSLKIAIHEILKGI